MPSPLPRKRVHIMSAGESLYPTFIQALKRYGMDSIIVISGRLGSAKAHSAIRESIEQVMATAQSIDLEFRHIEVEDESLESIRDSMVEVLTEHGDADFKFNVTGGKKTLSLGLFMMSIWLQGTSYYVRKEEGGSGGIVELSVPRIHRADMERNPNLLLVLDLLDRARSGNSDPEGGIPRKILYEELSRNGFRPVRLNNGKERRKPSNPMLSKWLDSLEGRGLVEVRTSPTNRRERIVRITMDGIFTLRFAKACGLSS